MQQTSATDFFCRFAQLWFYLHTESAPVFLILTSYFYFDLNFDIIVCMHIITRENLFYPCKIGWHRTVPGYFLTTPTGHRTHRCRTVPGHASADVIIYRRRPAPVQYVTTLENNL